MLSLLIATLCTTTPGPPYCIEEMVAEMPVSECRMHGQFALAAFITSGKYSKDWRIEKFSCERPEYVVKRGI